ncbi:SEC-C metal-binding domain-containing protein [Rhodopseudomonas parapalustris]
MRNRFGLSRNIPADVRRQVRRRDGFGCIVCGKAIYDYEHINPEFADATRHDPDGIVLLCISCHGKKTRGFLSLETICAARANPKCKQQGFSFEPLDIGQSPPQIIIGTLEAIGVQSLIEIDGVSIFSIATPAADKLPFRVNAQLSDDNGAEILRIVDNEWRSSADNWDVETSAARITIRRGVGDIVLALRVEPPRLIVIERLSMFFRGTTIRCAEKEEIEIITPSGRVLSSGGMSLKGCRVGIQVDHNGLSVGVGGGAVSIRQMTLSCQKPRWLSASNNIRRNSPCNCGSGQKYKHCCGAFLKKRG